jgi:LAO/AO transport system kinase
MRHDISALFEGLLKGDRVALGKALTLAESTLLSDREAAVALLDLCEKETKLISNSVRFAVSGAPGAGKSTLLEKIGLKAISEGFKPGILTVDPSSSISKGSILGDKSRMPLLSQSEQAFIRSSPAGSVLGGIGRRSRELMSIMAVAGFDYVFIETVGVGQSEHIAWQLTDGFILVVQPGAGDELQGIKRGITELADIVIVNKADGRLLTDATISKGQYEMALHYLQDLRKGWDPKVILCSALENKGIDDFWGVLRLYRDSRIESGQLAIERVRQNQYWLSWSAGVTAHELMMKHEAVNQKLQEGLHDIGNLQTSVFRVEFEVERMMNQLISSSRFQKD